MDTRGWAIYDDDVVVHDGAWDVRLVIWWRDSLNDVEFMYEYHGRTLATCLTPARYQPAVH